MHFCADTLISSTCRRIHDSEKGLFDVVLVWKLDRFSRDRYDSAHDKRILKKNGVRVISARENISEGPEGIILESMLEGYAEYYSAELSAKIQRGQKENALKCRSNGGNIEDWVCTRCGKLFADANGTQELTPDEVILPRLVRTDTLPQTGDSSRLTGWLALLGASSCA